MKSTNKNAKNAGKLAVLAVMIAVIASTVVGTTFASLSASYVWNADKVTPGSFDYVDSEYSFNLFGGKREIFPGDSGSGRLSGPNFGSDPVTWSFTEENPADIPVVYFISEGENLLGLYSAYDYSVLVGEFVSIGGKYVAASDISSDPSVIAAELSVGVELRWSWPSEVYAAGGADYVVSSTAAAEAYRNFCEKLCLTTYAFDNSAVTLLNSGSVMGYATALSADGFEAKLIGGAVFALEGNLIADEGALVPIYDGSFKTPDSTTAVGANDCYYVFVAAQGADAFASSAAGSGIRAERAGNYTYAQNVFVASESGNRALFKIYPAAAGEKAGVKVTITATVTK